MKSCRRRLIPGSILTIRKIEPGKQDKQSSKRQHRKVSLVQFYLSFGMCHPWSFLFRKSILYVYSQTSLRFVNIFSSNSLSACACKLSWTLLSPARVQPLYRAGKKESSGTGLQTPKRQTQLNRRMKCVNISRSKKGSHKHSHKCKERRTLMISLTQINRWKRCVNIPRSEKGAQKHKFKCGGRSIAHQRHNETRTHADDESTC